MKTIIFNMIMSIFISLNIIPLPNNKEPIKEFMNNSLLLITTEYKDTYYDRTYDVILYLIQVVDNNCTVYALSGYYESDVLVPKLEKDLLEDKDMNYEYVRMTDLNYLEDNNIIMYAKQRSKKLYVYTYDYQKRLEPETFISADYKIPKKELSIEDYTFTFLWSTICRE